MGTGPRRTLWRSRLVACGLCWRDDPPWGKQGVLGGPADKGRGFTQLRKVKDDLERQSCRDTRGPLCLRLWK